MFVLINSLRYGQFAISDQCRELYFNKLKNKGLRVPELFYQKLVNGDPTIRSDKNLIQAVKELKERADTPMSKLEISEVNGRNWFIVKLYGQEQIMYDLDADERDKTEMKILKRHAINLALLYRNQQWVQELVKENDELKTEIKQLKFEKP